MRGENDFNRYLTMQIRKLGTSVKAFKMSDRFHIGASDWMIYHGGRAVALEAKYVREEDRKKVVLKYKITGPQLTFMKSMALAGVPGFFLIGVQDTKRMYLVPAGEVASTGQLHWDELFDTSSKTVWFHISEVAEMITYLFGEFDCGKGSSDEVAEDRCTGVARAVLQSDQ